MPACPAIPGPGPRRAPPGPARGGPRPTRGPPSADRHTAQPEAEPRPRVTRTYPRVGTAAYPARGRAHTRPAQCAGPHSFRVTVPSAALHLQSPQSQRERAPCGIASIRIYAIRTSLLPVTRPVR